MRRPFLNRSRIVSLVLLLATAATPLYAQVAPRDPSRWESTILGFEKQDRENPPPKGGIVFVGASSIVRWNLAEFFPDLKVINRGFGGSELSETAHYAARTVLPYEPRIVVVYPGENDIARGVAPETVAGAFEQLVSTVHAALPQTRIFVIGLKPTPARWKWNDAMLKTNTLIQTFAATHPAVSYISVTKAMLGPDGLPRPDLFVEDRQHLSRAGYDLWTEIVRPHIE